MPGRGTSGRAVRSCGAPSTRRSRPAISPMRSLVATTSSRTSSPAAIRSPRCSARLKPALDFARRGAVRSGRRPHHRTARVHPDAPRSDADVRLASKTQSSTRVGSSSIWTRIRASHPPACWYWIRKLQARFFAGAHAAALEAASKAQRLLWTSPGFFELAEYHLYAALARAALCDAAAGPAGLCISKSWPLTIASSRSGRRTARKISRTAPRWSAPRSLVSRAGTLDAMRLYEQAIRSARANGFVHNEALAYELAARFYAARGFEEIATSICETPATATCDGAPTGKVRQLDELYPHLREQEPSPGPTSTIAAPVEHLDLATVIKVSQAVSGEIVLEKLIDTLMRTAIEQAGAERGLLILPRGGESSGSRRKPRPAAIR